MYYAYIRPVYGLDKNSDTTSLRAGAMVSLQWRLKTDRRRAEKRDDIQRRRDFGKQNFSQNLL